MNGRRLLIIPTESTATADTGLGVRGWTPASTGTMTDVPTVEQRRRGIWLTAVKTLAVAALPFADVYDPPRRRRLQTAVSHVLIIGEEDIEGDLLIEPESVLAVMPDRPTLWLPDAVPLLPPRRPFIASWDLVNEDE